MTSEQKKPYRCSACAQRHNGDHDCPNDNPVPEAWLSCPSCGADDVILDGSPTYNFNGETEVYAGSDISFRCYQCETVTSVV